MPRAQVVLVSMLLLGASRAVAATLQPLGDLPGGAFSSNAYAVSADGSVVVGQSESASGYAAFRWTTGGGMVDLGNLPGGGSYNAAGAVSTDGSVVVGVSQSALGTEAFRWTAGGGMVGLGVGFASGVSADGSVVVGGAGSVGHGGFRWTAGGGKVGLYVSEYEDVASGVSADGSVVVGHTLVEVGDYTPPEAFRWTYEGGAVLLGDLPGGEFESYANGISADGSVVIGQSESAFGHEAFRWTSGGGMVGLGDLPGGEYISDAKAVSGDGSVIVGGVSTASGGEAFRWTSGGGMQRLWDLLLAQGVDPAAGGWSSLIEATGVSADGNTIVGYGTRNGNTEAFRAFVPNSVAQLPGDFNNDGNVNAADYVVWRKGLGTIFTQDDYNMWRTHYGQTAGSSAALPSAESPSAAVPEPTTKILLLTAATGLCFRRDRTE